MPKTTCHTCFNEYEWIWEDAFDKFGFNDGDGQVMTEDVIAVLDNAGYSVTSDRWGLHNEIIVSIIKDGIEQIPASAHVGYDAPRTYLPKEIVTLLDEKLPEHGEAAS